MTSEPALRRLIAETTAYLGGLEGAGVAESRARLAEVADGAFRPVEARPHPVVDALLAPASALLAAEPGRAALAEAIAAAAPSLAWRGYDLYDRARIGAAFADGHAFASVIGADGPVLGADVELGLFVIAPGVLYRDHRHAAPELYMPLTGPHGWRFRPGDPLDWRPAHTPVWNPPRQPHATKVGARPFLCLYLWHADVAERAEVVSAEDWAALEAGGALGR